MPWLVGLPREPGTLARIQQPTLRRETQGAAPAHAKAARDGAGKAAAPGRLPEHGSARHAAVGRLLPGGLLSAADVSVPAQRSFGPAALQTAELARPTARSSGACRKYELWASHARAADRGSSLQLDRSRAWIALCLHLPAPGALTGRLASLLSSPRGSGAAAQVCHAIRSISHGASGLGGAAACQQPLRD